MNDPGHPYDWLLNLALGVVGAVFSMLAALGIKGTRDILRDLETSKLRIAELERRLDHMDKHK